MQRDAIESVAIAEIARKSPMPEEVPNRLVITSPYMRGEQAVEQRKKVSAIRDDIVTRLPWLEAPAFVVSHKEGYVDRAYGCRSGPIEDMSAENVLHEVAHAIEMTLLPTRTWHRRLQQNAFGMTIKSYQTITGQRYYEPVTMQATERECRVGGIQLRLFEAAGYPADTFISDYALVLKYMADWFMGGSCPLNTHDPKDYSAGEREWLNARKRLVAKAYDDFPLADIQERWAKVMQFMETKQQS